MTEHDHTNTEDYHTQHDSSVNHERRSTAGPTDAAPLKPALVSKCVACGERSAPHELPDSIEICRCRLSVRRGNATHREGHSRPLSTELARLIIESIEEH